jgi:DNA-binding NarL/FixJ family response regulator
VLESGDSHFVFIFRKMLNSFQHKTGNQYNLTALETDLLQLLIKDNSVKIICGELKMPFDTIRSYPEKMCLKLHVNCGQEAIAKTLKEKLAWYRLTRPDNQSTQKED